MKYYSFVNGLNQKEWEDLKNCSSHSTIFNDYNFYKYLNINFSLVGLKNQKTSKIDIAMPIFREKGLNVRLPFVPYQGILIRNSKNSISKNYNLISYFLDNLENENIKFNLTLSTNFIDMRPFIFKNYKKQNKSYEINLKYTAILNLKKFSNFENWLTSIRKLRLREYRKSKQNHKIIELKNSNEFLELHDQTYLKNDANLNKLQKKIRDKIIEYFNGKCFFKKILDNNNEISSILFFVTDKNRSYYLFGANKINDNSGLSTTLMIEYIKSAFQKNLDQIDFCGANSLYRGDYKLSFACDLSNYFEVKN